MTIDFSDFQIQKKHALQTLDNLDEATAKEFQTLVDLVETELKEDIALSSARAAETLCRLNILVRSLVEKQAEQSIFIERAFECYPNLDIDVEFYK